MRFAVISLFPQMLREALTEGVVGRALERGVFGVEYSDPREYTTDVHRTVDDRPYGGRCDASDAAGKPAGVFGSGWAQVRSAHGARGQRLAGLGADCRTL
jgi:hypothetical protein